MLKTKIQKFKEWFLRNRVDVVGSSAWMLLLFEAPLLFGWIHDRSTSGYFITLFVSWMPLIFVVGRYVSSGILVQTLLSEREQAVELNNKWSKAINELNK